MKSKLILLAIAIFSTIILFLQFNNTILTNISQNDESIENEFVLDRWADALGGSALSGVHGIYSRGVLRAAGLEGKLEEWATSSGNYRSYFDLAGIISETLVFNSITGEAWRLDTNQQVQSLEGVDLEAIIADAYFASYSQLIPGRMRGEIISIGESGDSWQILIRPEDGEEITYIIDSKTFLPKSRERFEGQNLLTLNYSDWRRVDGIMVPYSLHQTDGDPDSDGWIEFEEILINESIAAETFEPPEPAVSAVRFLEGRENVQIPFELINNHIYLSVQVNNGTPLWFALDTGADFTLIDQQVALELGLEQAGEFQVAGAGEESRDAALANNVSFQLNELEFIGQTVVVLDVGNISDSEGHPMAGILGYDLIGQVVLEIDYEKRFINFHDPSFFEYSGEGTAIPITLEGNDPFIQAEIEVAGQLISGKFMVDSGAGSSLILGKPFIEEHNLFDTNINFLEGTAGLGIGGEIEQRIGRISALSFGPFELNNIVTKFAMDERGALANPDRAGILGAEVLRRFTTIFDYQNRILILKPNKHLGEPFEFNMSGLSLKSSRPEFDSIIIESVLNASPAAEAGFQADDIILSVDGRPAREWTLESLRQLFRVHEAEHKIIIEREGSEIELTIILRRLI